MVGVGSDRISSRRTHHYLNDLEQGFLPLERDLQERVVVVELVDERGLAAARHVSEPSRRE